LLKKTQKKHELKKHFESWGTIYSYFEIGLKPAIVSCLTNALALRRLR